MPIMNLNLKINRPIAFFISFIFISLSLALSTQELDEDYLQGLPLDVQKRIELANDEEDIDELDQLLSSESSIQKNEALLEYLSKQVEILKESMRDQDPDEVFRRFGESFFDDFQSTFMPVNIANLGSDYIVDVGDELTINTYGKLTQVETSLVSRDGTITIPSIGKITVAGKSFNEVEALFNSFLKSNAIGIEGSLSLSKLRDIQVLVLGYVFRPGIYTLSGGSSILGAIKAAGGVDSNGSYREISHIRNGKVLRNFDLYDVFIKGIYDPSFQLRSGDSVLINPVKKLIPISGGVNRPAIYELVDTDGIEELLQFAGGVSEASLGNKVLYVKKFSDEKAREVELDITNLASYKLASRDQVIVPFYSQDVDKSKQVSIKGWVRKPGVYSLRDGDTFEDLINKAGGYKEGAYSYGISLFRDEAKKLENEIMLLEYSKTIDNLVSSIGSPGAGDANSALTILQEGLRSRQPKGRVINNFLINPKIELYDDDEIVIPKLQKVVYLFGEFNRASNAFYNEESDIKDYIEIGGGLTKNATEYLVIIDPDGKSNIYRYKNLVTMISLKTIDIYPGSIIYAPRDIGKLTGIQYASSVAPILSSLALSLASLNSINN